MSKISRLSKSFKKEVISAGKRRKIKTKSIQVKQSFRTSFAFALFIRIVFFPFFAFRWYIRLAKESFSHFLLFNFITLFVIAVYVITCVITLPDVKKLTEYKPILSSKFYDRNGELIFESSSEKRTYVNINNVPKKLVQAFIAAEDKTFYTNPGFDVFGLVRTAITDVYKLMRRQKLYGASTITQQVVKNVLLSNERSITRKVKELILSRKVAKQLSKDKVMEIYLNHIYLGMQAYGVVVASEEYFGKTLAELTIPEMAMLAALPKAPSYINPFRNYNRAVQRRNYVLLRMFEDGYITRAEYEQAVSTPLVVHKRKNQWAPFYAPAFFAQGLMGNKEIGISSDNILNDGYNIKLTIDKDLQIIAQTALNNTLENYTKNHGFSGALFTYDENDVKTKTPDELLRAIDEPENLGDRKLAVVLSVMDDETTIGLRDNSTAKITFNDLSWARQKISETAVSTKQITKCGDVLKVGDVIVVKQKIENSNYYTLEQIPSINGGVLAMNPRTGEILAMVGGYMDQAGGFNRAVQAFRQVGSTIKPFVYATALEQGFTPASIFMDSPLSINLGNGITWDPANSSRTTDGPTTLRIGLERSKNTVTVRVADAIGINAITNVIKNAGINQKPEGNFSVALGSVDSSIIKMAKAYSSFANGGILPNVYLINGIEKNDKVADSKGFGRVYFENCNINLKCDIMVRDWKKRLKVVDLSSSEDDFEDNVKVKPTNYLENNGDENVNEQENAEEDVEMNKEGSEAGDQQDEKAKKPKQLRLVKVFKPTTAYQMASILQGAVIRGTSAKLSSLGLPIASKTGTSDGGRDMWNIVISPDLVIVVYVGHDQPMDTNNYGNQYALPVSKEILTKLMTKMTFNNFKTPEGIKFVKIDRHTGKPTNRELDKDVIFEAFKENDEISSPVYDDAGGVSNDGDKDEEQIDISDL